MTMFSRKTVMTALAAASLAVAGAALTTAPAAAKGGHGGHHGGGHHGHHGHGHGHGGHWGHGHWGHSGVRIVSYYGGGYDGCYVVRQKVFVPGFGFVRRPVTVCD